MDSSPQSGCSLRYLVIVFLSMAISKNRHLLWSILKGMKEQCFHLFRFLVLRESPPEEINIWI